MTDVPAAAPADPPKTLHADGAEPDGALIQGHPGRLLIMITNGGSASADNLAAHVVLPEGVQLRGGGNGVTTSADAASQPGPTSQFAAPKKWTCDETTDGATCTLGTLGPGESSTLALKVKVDKKAESGTVSGAVAAEGVTVPIPDTWLEVSPK